MNDRTTPTLSPREILARLSAPEWWVEGPNDPFVPRKGNKQENAFARFASASGLSAQQVFAVWSRSQRLLRVNRPSVSLPLLSAPGTALKVRGAKRYTEEKRPQRPR